MGSPFILLTDRAANSRVATFFIEEDAVATAAAATPKALRTVLLRKGSPAGFAC